MMMEIMYSDWGLILGNYNLAIGNKINDWDLRLEWGLGFEILIRDWRLGTRIEDWGSGSGSRLGILIRDYVWGFGGSLLG